jgi:hypothetical protein
VIGVADLAIVPIEHKKKIRFDQNQNNLETVNGIRPMMLNC